MGWLMSVEQIRAGSERGVTNNAAGRLNANGDALKEDYFSNRTGAGLPVTCERWISKLRNCWSRG